MAEEDQGYQPSNFARRVMRHEEVVMGLMPIAQFATTAE